MMLSESTIYINILNVNIYVLNMILCDAMGKSKKGT